ncbi:hypothetical protein D9M72_577660 [compost metagenome]
MSAAAIQVLFLFEQRLIMKPRQSVVEGTDGDLDALFKDRLFKFVRTHDLQIDMDTGLRST